MLPAGIGYMAGCRLVTMLVGSRGRVGLVTPTPNGHLPALFGGRRPISRTTGGLDVFLLDRAALIISGFWRPTDGRFGAFWGVLWLKTRQIPHRRCYDQTSRCISFRGDRRQDIPYTVRFEENSHVVLFPSFSRYITSWAISATYMASGGI